MNDLTQNDLNTLRRVLRELDALRAEVAQLRRERFPAQHNSRHDPVFAITNAAGTAVEVERIVRNADDDAWIRSGEKFDAQTVGLDTPPTISSAAICLAVAYEGKETIVPLSIEVHRGITNEAMTKGGTAKSVSRYMDGTNSDSLIDDQVLDDFINVGIGKKVVYLKIGSNFYLIAVECPPT